MEALSTLEQQLVELGFTASPKGRRGQADGYIFSGDYTLDELAPLLQARLRRQGMRHGDHVGLHYNDAGRTLTLLSLHHDVCDEIPLDSPRARHLLWSLGLDATALDPNCVTAPPTTGPNPLHKAS